MSEKIVKVKPLGNTEIEARVKTVWLVARSDEDYPYFKVISIVPDEEKALDEAAYIAAFRGHRGFYWKVQEVDLTHFELHEEKVKEVS